MPYSSHTLRANPHFYYISPAAVSQQGIAAQLTGRREPAVVITNYKSYCSKQEAALLTSGHIIPILFLVTHQQALQTLPPEVQSVNYYGCLPKSCPIKDMQKAVESFLGNRIAHQQAPEEVVPPFALPLPAGR